MKWAGSRDKIFSPSGRGRAFFLTFLFIERFDRWSMSDIGMFRQLTFHSSSSVREDPFKKNFSASLKPPEMIRKSTSPNGSP